MFMAIDPQKFSQIYWIYESFILHRDETEWWCKMERREIKKREKEKSGEKLNRSLLTNIRIKD